MRPGHLAVENIMLRKPPIDTDSHRLALAGILVALMTIGPDAQYTKPKTNVAHRGASAYAPEHTLAAYKLAIEMGADYVEQDLAVTRDGILICLHDASLERTTNVEQLFPDRVSTQTIEGKTRKAWLANDFTLAEIKTLDAGSWFDPKFKSEKIPTFDEAIALIRGKAGIFPELKTPEIYAGRSVDFETLVADALDRNGLRGRKADATTPVILQTFGRETARNLAKMQIGVPVVLLMEYDNRLRTADQVKSWKGVVQGFGPAKRIVFENADFVKWAHAEGMTVTPYTFRSSDVSKSGFRTVDEEMSHFLYRLNVDALFTDNPDRFPRK
jgi:glycerophosphoryl diester phosphodiesterase